MALIGGLIGSAAIGMLLELVAFRPIRKRGNSHLAPVVSTIGAGLVLQEVMTKIVRRRADGVSVEPEPGEL